MNKFVFLLAPSLSGTSLIKELFETSEAVSTFLYQGKYNTGEGQFLDRTANIMGIDNRWDPTIKFDWNVIKEIFLDYWNLEKPILFEKSPPNLLRATQIEQVFAPAYFIISLRNPYAQIEGLYRRKWISPPAAAAEFWVKCAKYQIKNIATLQNRIFFSYEDLTNNTDQVLEKMSKFLPELGLLNKEKIFNSHNITSQPIQGIVNLNEQKIKLLSPEVIREINKVLKANKDLLEHFAYNLIDI